MASDKTPPKSTRAPTPAGPAPSGGPKKPDSIGSRSGEISVELSTRFLEHFSEQLYSSPQKAFEELISNGWDAGADYVDVRIAANLKEAGATLSVLDNGESMNEEGLKLLWHIASSPKKDTPVLHGRPVIGKFGIGKLATYVLANKLTYICKAADGVIRRVTMDYGNLEHEAGVDGDKLVRDLKLEIFTATEEDVYEAINSVSSGEEIKKLIQAGVPKPADPKFEDEFGGPRSTFKRPTKDTWTLVILSELKETGKELKTGVLRRMLTSALPIGGELAIGVNGEILSSSKMDTPIMKEWAIGPDLKIDTIEFDEGDMLPSSGPSSANDKTVTTIKVKSVGGATPHVEVDGVGKITGRVRLYKERITKGKSEERGTSNGFHVNVLGRVVNQSDPSFGEENLSHAVWACFRMTVRADSLNEFLTTNREQFKERRPIKVFRAFLRKVFNVARGVYDSDETALLPDGGDVLVKSLGVVSLSPLRNVVDETLAGRAPVPGLFDEEGVQDREAKRKSWQQDTSENIKSALHEVRFERMDDGSFVKFRLVDNLL
jgi:hypothetical protein